NSDGAQVPPDFEQALLSLRGRHRRPEVHLEEVPPPTRIAPYALALTAEINPTSDPETLLGSGRFVVLHDPAGQSAWHGTFRVIVMARAQLEDELGADPLLGGVGRAWRTDASSSARAGYHTLHVTFSRVLSESIGALSLRGREVEIVVRATWTPNTTDLGPHLDAWTELACSNAGLEPLPDG